MRFNLYFALGEVYVFEHLLIKLKPDNKRTRNSYLNINYTAH